MLGNVFGSAPAIEINLEPDPNRRQASVSKDRRGPRSYVYSNGEDIAGTCAVNVKPGSTCTHLGLKVEFLGQVEMLSDRSKTHTFFSMEKNLQPPGLLSSQQQFTWRFARVDMDHESYYGKNVHVRYFVRVVLQRKAGSGGNVSKEVDFVVQNPRTPADSEIMNPIKMEVGIEEMLRIEFEFDKCMYHMRDVLVGKVYFMLVRIKIKKMELKLVRRETVGSGGSQQMENETLTEFEIMDGAPVKDECIPVRLYLTGLELTPTYSNVHHVSVKYFLNLVLIDEEDRKYFKKQEFTIYRP